MPDHAANARLLLTGAPDSYVAERTRLVKQARADGDRERANFYQALKRPNLSLWAVLVAGEDVDAVQGIVAETIELAKIQTAGAASDALSAATKSRRKTLETLVDRAVKALARSVSGAESRRPEIRAIIDQLSRHPDVAATWIDGTLRDLPDDAFGFAAFTGVTETTAKTPASRRAKPAKPARPLKPPADDTTAQPAIDLAAERAARAERAQLARQARHDVAVAARQLAAAERRVAAAQATVREAQDALRLAEDERATAQQHHQEANAQLDATRDE